jgi:gliding motility-associated-like protein
MTTMGQNCELVNDTSNTITLSVNPESYATVSIAASDSAVCAGMPITFTATVTNGTSSPGFNWFVDGQPSGITTPTFTDTSAGSQVVFCETTSNASCGLAKSNSIPVGIYPQPAVPNQTFSVRHGEGLTLDPQIDGDVTSYRWTPGLGLSDSSIRNPYADPPATVVYTLQVTSPGGCTTKGDITVDVYTPLSLPNAFTPNGDGHNDRFYVLGGPAGSVVQTFAIYDRWGARLYSAQNLAPGDTGRGWDGTISGHPAPSGTYVYIIVMTLPGGHRQTYQGTVMLIR